MKISGSIIRFFLPAHVNGQVFASPWVRHMKKMGLSLFLLLFSKRGEMSSWRGAIGSEGESTAMVRGRQCWLLDNSSADLAKYVLFSSASFFFSLLFLSPLLFQSGWVQALETDSRIEMGYARWVSKFQQRWFSGFLEVGLVRRVLAVWYR